MENNSNKISKSGIALLVLGALLLIVGMIVFISRAFSFSMDFTRVYIAMGMFALGGILLVIGAVISGKKAGIGSIIHKSASIFHSKLEAEKLEAENELAKLKNQAQESKTCPGCGAAKKGDGHCPYCGR